ncbi:MAG: hypothetical protein JXB48_08105 [Candidatus Latescibacteria bacterium]|nr:hypothetical protein [Candidatus Latescibacterota bacterium]
MDVKKFFSTGETADLLGISRATVARKYDRGLLSGKRNPITGERMVSFISIADFMKKYNVSELDEPHESKKVFIATTDKKVISSITDAIGDDGRFNIEILSHGSDTLIRSTRESADILIIDSHLPDVNSVEVVRSLRRMNVNENMKILLCADSDLVSEEQNKEIIDSYIPKDRLENNIIKEKIFSLFDFGSDKHKIDATYGHERKWPRVEINIPAHILSTSIHPKDTAKKAAMVLKDISYGGALLSPLKFERLIDPFGEFKLQVRKSNSSLGRVEAISRIVRIIHGQSPLIGIEFIKISDEDRSKIMKLRNT